MTEDPSQTPAPLHPLYKVSGIGRPVDPRYATNKAMLVLVPTVMVGTAIWSSIGGASIGDALLAGLNLGLGIFLAWALTREMSPDDNPAAFVAVALILAVWPRVGAQSLSLLAGALFATRLVNRSTGKACELGDSILAALGFAALAWFESWTLGLVGALALLLDASLPCPGEQRRHKRHFALALVPAAASLARLASGIAPLQLPAHVPVFAVIAGLCLLALLVYPTPLSCGDVDAQPLSRTRVRLGLGMALLSVVLISVDSGFRLQSASALWACVLAVPLGLPLAVIRARRARNKT